MNLYWLSFVDKDSNLFLGVAIVEASSFYYATVIAHLRKCNPGGEVRGWEIPKEMEHFYPDEVRNRLLTYEEAKTLDKDVIRKKGN